MVFQTTEEIIKDIAIRFKKIRKMKKISQEELKLFFKLTTYQLKILKIQ